MWFILAFMAGSASAYIAYQRSERDLIARHEARVMELERQLRGCESRINELSAQNRALREELS